MSGTNGGGWTLAAIRTNNGVAPFAEAAYAPLLTSSGTSGKLSAVWSLSSTYSFREIRYTDTSGNWAIATFPSTTTMSALNGLYSTYTPTPTTATVTTNVGGLTNYYFRAQSGNNGYYSDSSDWAAMCFSVGGIVNYSDGWDISYAVWLLSGYDNGNDCMASGGAVGMARSGGGCHWPCQSNFASNVVYVWLR